MKKKWLYDEQNWPEKILATPLQNLSGATGYITQLSLPPRKK